MKVDMDLVSKYGQTMLNTKVSGEKTKPTEEESSGMLMVTFTKENGRTTKQMATEFTFTLMEPNTKVTGKMIFRTAKEWSLGKTEADMREATKKA